MDKFSDKNNSMARKIMARWKEERRFNTVKNDMPKYFITFPFPYVNGAPHIGHAYSMLRTDSYAKFKRLQGYNVLFPQGFHATGEPILGVIERLKKNDNTQKETLRMFGATDQDINSFIEDPKNIVSFWVKRWISDMEHAGCSVDWERSFITAGFSKGFNRFIEWQYNKLKDKGYIKQGTHPVIWCPHDNSPTGDHDRLVGEGESPQEYDIILFDTNEGMIACATLRPETIFEAHNIWVAKGEYCIAIKDDIKWILSESSVTKLKDQLHEIKIVGNINSDELTRLTATNPITGKKMPVFESSFVDINHGTGIVMSVPSHAPYDYIALKEIANEGNDNAKRILNEAKNMILLEGVPKGMLNAEHYCKKHHANSINNNDGLTKATTDLYKAEYHKGKVTIKELEGLGGEEAKNKAKEMISDKHRLSSIYEMTGQVVCRCTTKCHVKILENQWFIDYKDEGWKRISKEHLNNMTIEPEISRTQFENTIDWLEYKACARKSGFGTKLPYDDEWIVETLSDSTIYNAYYTISKHINQGLLREEDLTDEALDYIFMGIESEDIKDNNIYDDLRKEFEYYYPVDMRNSGKDLIQNHLTFYIMQHTALFEKKHWPRGISVNGFVNVEGEKMAKSKGNIIPLRELMEEHGPDFVRIGMVASTEGMEDANWSVSSLQGYYSRINNIASIADSIKGVEPLFKVTEINIQDKMLLHYHENAKRKSYSHYEQLRFRSAALESYYNLTNAIKQHSKYGLDKRVLSHIIREFLIMNYPLLPYSTEELYHSITGKSILDEKWPVERNYNFDYIKEKITLHENIRDDIQSIMGIILKKGKKPGAAHIVIAEEWAYEMLRMKDEPLSEIMKRDNIRVMGGEAAKAYGKIKTIEWPLNRTEERECINEIIPLIEHDLGIKVTITESGAKQGLPGKPGIIIVEE
ncbi:MAG: leucine--tRNA ligase [Candidatus Woesearchaeota archaeon]